MKLPDGPQKRSFLYTRTIVPVVYLTHRREDIYPEPKRFKPDRFLERQFSPYEYLPFGGGNRRCIGALPGRSISRVGVESRE